MRSWAFVSLGLATLCALASDAQAGLISRTSAIVETVGADSALDLQVGDALPITLKLNVPTATGFRLEFDIDFGPITVTQDMLTLSQMPLAEVFWNEDGDVETFHVSVNFDFGGQSFFFESAPPTLFGDRFRLTRRIDAMFVEVAAGRFDFPAKVMVPEPSALGLLGLAGLWSLVGWLRRGSSHVLHDH